MRPRGGRYAPDATRRAIIESALGLFETNGFHATSVQQVAQRAHVTKGAFYHHFESKDELIHTIVDEFVDQQLRDVREVAEKDASAAGKVEELIRRSVLNVASHRSTVAIYAQENRYLTGARFDGVRAKREEIFVERTAIVRAGMDAGEFDGALDPAVVARAIMSLTSGVAEWLTPGDAEAAEAVAATLAKMVLGGVRA